MSIPHPAVETWAPEYRNADGQRANDPLQVVGATPTVDVAALAKLFTAPALIGEFTPGAYWHDVDMAWRLPAADCTAQSVPAVFTATVAGLCAESETVGVKVSGGLDSLAVLCQVAALDQPRRIVAYCVDLTDDQRISSASVVDTLLARVRAATGRDVDLVVVDPEECTRQPRWSPHGPRLESMPAVNAAIAAHAAATGVELLLHGDGADELLGVPRYATAAVLAGNGVRAAWRYVRDFHRSGPGVAGELVAAGMDRLPATVRMQGYWAANWPHWCVPTTSPVLGTSFREEASAWAADWIASQLNEHVWAGRRWASADTVDSFWPRAYTPAAGPVGEASPFLTPPMVAAGLALPPAQRYDAVLRHPYHRYKAVVVRLLPAWMRALLPTRKQYFTGALAHSAARELAVPLSSAVGLVDPHALADCTDTATRMTAAAVESWLAGAYAAGYRIPGLDQERAAG